MLYTEGIDKAGKTTFINNFSNYLDLPFYRKEPPNSLNPVEYHSYFKAVGYTLIETYKFFKSDLIVDRSFISDWIYTNRNVNTINISIWSEWEERHAREKLTQIILYFEIDKLTFEERINAQSDPYMNEDEYDKYVNMYEIYLENISFNYIRIPRTMRFVDQLQIVTSKLKEFKYESKSLVLKTLLQKLEG